MSDATETPTSAEPQEAVSPFEKVNITPEMVQSFVQSRVPIQTIVKVDGLKKLQRSVLSWETQKLESCTTPAELVHTMEVIRTRLMRSELFSEVHYNFEPLMSSEATNQQQQSSSAVNVLVQLEVKEVGGSQEFGVFTTETVVPELRLKLRKLFGRGLSFSAQYAPPASKLHSWSGQFIAHLPWIGDRMELNFTQSQKTFSHCAAENERLAETTLSVDSFADPERQRNWYHRFIFGWQKQTLQARDASVLPPFVTLDLFEPFSKCYLRHEAKYSNVSHHWHPMLRQMYPLPISGVEGTLSQEMSGGVLGGNCTALKQELQFTWHRCLHPLLTWSNSVRLGAVWGLGDGISDRIHLGDRLFLSWRHIRGHKSIGPSTLNCPKPQTRGGTEGSNGNFDDDDDDNAKLLVPRYGAIGGNALWAFSSNLNFPFLFLPENGFLASHLFFNVGNLQLLQSFSELKSKFWDLFSNPPMAVGAGFIVTQLPLMGMIPNGRFELNVSVPISFSSQGGLQWNVPLDRNLFQRVKFGLQWCSTCTQ